MKKLKQSVLAVLTVLTVLFYLPLLFVYQVSPGFFWPMGVLGIAFIYIDTILLAMAIAWLFFNKKVSLLILLALIAGLPILKNVVATHLPKPFSVKKKAGTYRVMQWNCNGLQGINDFKASWQIERKKACQFIEKYQPDIICIQDFSETIGPGNNSNIALLRDTLHYPYFVFDSHYFMQRRWGDSWTGIAIFSKFPIVDSGSISYPDKIYPESILWADLAINQEKIRIITTHFQSMHLSQNLDTEPLDQTQWQDSLVIIWGSKWEKLKYFQPYHARQAHLLQRFTDTCKMPFIMGADLNSVPSSYPYKIAKGKLKDAFLEKGSGLGRTYHSWQPALRIDYLFHNSTIMPQQFGTFRTSFSDHDPLIMEFEIK